MEIKTAIQRRYIYIVLILLAAASFVAFGRTAGNDFINLDDNKYITENNNIQSGFILKSIKWAATAVVVGNWHPLTLFSHMLDWSLFGANASGHHIVSLLLHIGAVIFLFLFLNKTTNNLWPSAFATALFAIHPLRVESVAWAAERKDVLSMFFGMASIYTYSFYAEKNKISKYFLCLILFVFALMSKPMMVTIPFLLMLLDYWPLERWQKALNDPSSNRLSSAGKLILEKIPFILLTILFVIIAFRTHTKGTFITSVFLAPFLTRCANAAVSYATYIEKTFWPTNLVVYYPYDFSPPLGKVLICVIILLLITAAVVYHIRKLPFLFVGWFWYLGTLVPVIGLFQFGTQSMADRYTYLPSIGITVMISWGIALLLSRYNITQKIFLPVGIVIIILLTVLTWRQCGYWKNSITLFSRTLQLTKNNYVAHNHLASALLKKRLFDKVIHHYDEAIRINPIYAHAYYNRGIAYYTFGQKMRALDDFKKASGLIPKSLEYASVYNNIGVIYTDFGQYQPAIDNFNEAIRLDPHCRDALNNRAYVYLKYYHNLSGCNDARKACELGNCKTLEIVHENGLCR
ncbi:MAG: glycosyltransferase family 39 protein [Syntrophaceae bacterium]|nr:glycosyltransferase family 39 protein [Syntrophaceae bacterium]